MIESEREINREREIERKKERKKERYCVCVILQVVPLSLTYTLIVLYLSIFACSYRLRLCVLVFT